MIQKILTCKVNIYFYFKATGLTPPFRGAPQSE